MMREQSKIILPLGTVQTSHFFVSNLFWSTQMISLAVDSDIKINLLESCNFHDKHGLQYLPVKTNCSNVCNRFDT